MSRPSPTGETVFTVPAAKYEAATRCVPDIWRAHPGESSPDFPIGRAKGRR